MPGSGKPHAKEAGDRAPGWARRELAREVDRIRNPLPVGPAPKSTGNLSDGWRALQQRARRSVDGADDPAAGSGWKRPVKRAVFGVLRPAMTRYESLIAELTAYGGLLAERLEESEAEIAKLQGRLDALGGSGSPDEPEPSGPKATDTQTS
jgi:hypothetical protein